MGFVFLAGSQAARGDEAPGDPESGRALAVQWCSSCHDVGPGGVDSDRVPSFQTIMHTRGRSEDWLRTWLSVPHESMPSFSLSRREIADLVAYLDSLMVAD